MQYQHRLHYQAHIDIIEAYEWYELQKENLGEGFSTEIQNKIKEIVTNPFVFSSKANANYREAIVKKFPYVIVYKIIETKKQIFISSIHHSKKNPKGKYRK